METLTIHLTAVSLEWMFYSYRQKKSQSIIRLFPVSEYARIDLALNLFYNLTATRIYLVILMSIEYQRKLYRFRSEVFISR